MGGLVQVAAIAVAASGYGKPVVVVCKPRSISRSSCKSNVIHQQLRCCSSQREFFPFCTLRNDASSSSMEDQEQNFGAEDVNIDDTSSSSSSPTPAAAAPSQHSWWTRLRKVDWSLLILKIPEKDNKLWMVPWTGGTIFQVMFLWFAAFWLVGSWVVPIAAHLLGCSKDTLTYRGQALYSLITDVAEGTVGLGILHRCLSHFNPLPGNWFPINWTGQWYVEACLGCLIFPLVNRLSQINLELLPLPTPFTSSNVEQSIIARDPIATLIYALLVSVCAPVWEEVIFRGFLLPSLTRYLPLWAAVVISAIAFAFAHFSLQRILPLTLLGLIMGVVFVRNRNLLSSILLHSLWNAFVFLSLMR